MKLIFFIKKIIFFIILEKLTKVHLYIYWNPLVTDSGLVTPLWLSAVLGGVVGTLMLLLVVLLISVTVLHRRRNNAITRRRNSEINVSARSSCGEKALIMASSVISNEVKAITDTRYCFPIYCNRSSLQCRSCCLPIEHVCIWWNHFCYLASWLTKLSCSRILEGAGWIPQSRRCQLSSEEPAPVATALLLNQRLHRWSYQ